MAYDYSKLLGRIVERFQNQTNFAEAMELSERSISMKLNNRVGWKQAEIVKASGLLNIPATDIHEYFFTLKVQ